MDTKQLVKTKKKRSRYFESYLVKQIKSMGSYSVSSNAKSQMNNMLKIITTTIVDRSIELTSSYSKKTISHTEVEKATRLVLTGEEGDACVEYANNVLAKKKDGGEVSTVIPHSLMGHFLRKFGASKLMVSKTSSLFLAAVVEFFFNMCVEKAIVVANSSNRHRLTIRDFNLGMRSSIGLDTILTRNNIEFIGAGTIPYIHESLDSSLRRRRKNTRAKPGMVALENIKKFQMKSNCLFLSKLPFERLVRELVVKHSDKDSNNESNKDSNKDSKQKIRKEVFLLLQYVMEQYVVDLLNKANAITLHSGRVKVSSKDIELVHNISL